MRSPALSVADFIARRRGGVLGSGRLEQRVVDAALDVPRQQGVEDVLRRRLEVEQRKDLALASPAPPPTSSRLSGSSRPSTGVCVIIETNSVKTMWSSSTPPSAVSFWTASISGPATFLASA